jgi:uncharacterized protein YggU (UPF0235/DUF167 family)
VRVAAAPERGKANDSLLALLARELHIPRSAIAVRSGLSHRLKTIAAEGDGDGLAARLAGFGEAN